MGEASINLYDLNKIAYAQLPILAAHTLKWEHAIEPLKQYVINHANKYFMLLNNDAHYYTLFHFDVEYNEEFLPAIKDCVLSIGDLIGVDYNTTTDAYELWFNQGGEILMYVFFGYDKGVIECHS